MKTNYFLFIIVVIITMSSCRKDIDLGPEPDPTDPISSNIEELIISPSFNFKTTDDVTIQLKAYDNQNVPIKNVRFNIYTAHPDSGGALMSSGATDNSGMYSIKIPIETFTTNFYAGTDYIGLPNMVKLNKTGTNITYNFGGSQASTKVQTYVIHPKVTAGKGAPVKYLGSYSTTGVPSYLESYNDYIGTDLLDDVNASLPERRPVPDYNPEYLENGNQTTLLVTQEADVWLTFVHEGAGNKNVLGYYVYNQNDVPQTENDIDSLIVIFPNVSFYNSGGGLYSGNKVNIGRFQPGTKIGWVLFQNGFSNGTVNVNAPKFYSDKWLNPETLESNKQHCVMIMDPGRELVLMGFEDLNRNTGSDNDFNDAVFYITTNPVQAINYSSMPTMQYTDEDTDDDEIPDNFDDYPTDPSKAFDSYYPSETTFGSLAFEDLWPNKGDYDFNDMVVDYRFITVTNAANEIVQIKANIYPKANGASFHNGFGFQLPVPPGAVQSVIGHNISDNVVTLAGNGVEAGQTKATIIVFDDAWNNFRNISGTNPEGTAGLNTAIGGRTAEPDTLDIEITLVNPLNSAVFGLPPYNPFIFINADRSREVHLADFPPTDLASTTFFNTGSDNSNPSTGRYYKSSLNLPWAINIINNTASLSKKKGLLKSSKSFSGNFSSFDYTTEKNQITVGHLKFANWAVSGGCSFKDWYKDESTYRNNNYIYH